MKAERKQQHEDWQRARLEIKKNDELSSFAEKEGVGLIGMSRDPLTNQPPTDLQGELRIAKQWVKLLGIENPVAEGTTLRDLLQRLFYEWQRQGLKLWNPFAKRFSEQWIFEPAGKNFEESWTQIEGADTLLLDAKDFADEPPKKKATGSPQNDAVKSPEGTDTPKKSLTQIAHEEWEKQNGRAPTLRYRGIILPHE